jgi:hypothetical protein
MNWSVAASNIAVTASFLGYVAVVALVGFALGMVFSKTLRDYVRNLEWVRKATDFFFVAWTNVWEDMKYFFAGTWDYIASILTDKLLGIKSILTDYIAQFLDIVHMVTGSERVSRLADYMRGKSLEADAVRRQYGDAYNRRELDRLDRRDRNIQAAYESSIFGEQERRQNESPRMVNDGAVADSNSSKIADNSDQQTQLLRQIADALSNRGVGTSKFADDMF